jgi:hypothetical protein
MMEQASSLHSEEDALSAPSTQSPLHGFRGQPEVREPRGVPRALSIAISREAGSRGTVIAQRAAAKLGWQAYSQDMLEYLCQEGTFRHDVLDQLPADAAAWIDKCLELLRPTVQSPSVLNLARTVLALAAQGEVVLLGRGAGCILPSRSTLNIRLVAPESDRIAYVSQWQRLTEEEATEHVRQADRRRASFIQAHFQREPGDLYQYDLIVNTSLLGEDRSAETIVQAARVKAGALV